MMQTFRKLDTSVGALRMINTTFNGTGFYVLEDFPAGITNIPVKSRQVLGYQGSWSGIPLWRRWVHASFALVKASGKNTFPEVVTAQITLEPVSYLELNIDTGNKNLQPMKCE